MAAKTNKHALRARKLAAKSDKAARRGHVDRSVRLGRKEDKAARKAGW